MTLKELREKWPRDDSGLVSAKLLVRFLTASMIETARGLECKAERSQAEAAGQKLFAEIITQFETIVDMPLPEKQRPLMKPLRSMQRSENNPNPEKK